MLAALIGAALVILALVDSFESLVLPRRVTRRWRPARMYFRAMWRVWRMVGLQLPARRYRDNAFSIFGPFTLLGLFVGWVGMLVTGFALIHWGRGLLGEAGRDFRDCLYHSGETFFTLGYGDVTPLTYGGKLLAVVEAGMGFGFMAVVIGYLPVLYQAFSHREQAIALLDARAGSPPTASELLRRHGPSSASLQLERFLAEWEAWAADLLESHLSYPILGYYRSQHDNQSWLAALACALDVSAVMIVVGDERLRRSAELSFAMARHASVDMCLVFWLPPTESARERLEATEAAALLAPAREASAALPEQVERLRQLRLLYEPFLESLSQYFCLALPRFVPERFAPDNWQTSAWTTRAPGITELPAAGVRPNDHFG